MEFRTKGFACMTSTQLCQSNCLHECIVNWLHGNCTLFVLALLPLLFSFSRMLCTEPAWKCVMGLACLLVPNCANACHLCNICLRLTYSVLVTGTITTERRVDIPNCGQAKAAETASAETQTSNWYVPDMNEVQNQLKL